MAERLDSGDDINTRFSVNINKLTPDSRVSKSLKS